MKDDIKIIWPLAILANIVVIAIIAGPLIITGITMLFIEYAKNKQKNAQAGQDPDHTKA